MLTAVVVALVLLTAAFLIVLPAQDRTLSSPALSSTGLRTDVDVTPSYFVEVGFATQPVLPGYHDTLLYEVLNDTSGAPISTLSTITIQATYYNTLDKLLPLPGTPINVSTAPIGSFSFVVPANTSTDDAFEPAFTLYANSTSLHMNQSSSDDLEVGVLEIADAGVCDVVGPCGTLTTGNPATVAVNTQVLDGFGDTSPAAGELVKFSFYSTGSSPVTVPGVPASLTTNGLGDAVVTFTPLSSIFNVPGPNHVEIEVTDSVNASLTVFRNLTFDLLNPVGTANFAFYLNSALYYSGETGTATWQWAGTNSTVGTLNVTNFYVVDEETDNILDSGLIGSTSPTGTFSFTLPASYAGDFEVVAFVHNGTDSWTLESGAEAELAIFAAIPSEFYYNPGDVVTVSITAQGPALAGTTVSAFVQAVGSGQTLYNSSVTGGSFQFTIPAVAPADEYVIAAWAASPTNGTVATDTEHVYEASGYNLWAGINTVSSYSDGSFAPGQSVQISYKVTAYGTSQLPTVVELELLPGPCSVICGTDTPAIKIWFVNGASGSVPFTIPSGTPNGLQTFTVLADFPNGEGANQVTINVNSAPSALNYELGAGSGLTVGWLILLILIIVVALIIVVMRRRGKSSTMVMSPAPAASSSAPEWKEPPSGGSTSGTSDTPASPPGTQ
ncbi:MAG: hypothetical protein WA688_04135 [Thermoplasmata archaeon]